MEFRDYLAKDLNGLPLTEQARKQLLTAIGHPLHEDFFWHTLQDMWNDFRLANELKQYFGVLSDKYRPPEDSWFRRIEQNLETVRVVPWQELPEDCPFWQSQQGMRALTAPPWKWLFRRTFTQKYGEPPRQWADDAANILTRLVLIQFQARAYREPRSSGLQHVWGKLGKEAGLVTAVQEGLITERWVAQAIATLQWQQSEGDTVEKRRQAAETLREVTKTLRKKSESGRKSSKSYDETEKIAEEFAKWRPVVQRVNKEFKKLREAWSQTSKEKRGNFREALARKHSISVEELETIVRFIVSSGSRDTATPWEATAEMIGQQHGLVAGTVEAIYRDWLKTHPEHRTKKLKPSATPVAKRIA